MAKYRPRSEMHTKAEIKPMAQAKPQVLPNRQHGKQVLANVSVEPTPLADSKSGASIRFESVTKRARVVWLVGLLDFES